MFECRFCMFACQSYKWLINHFRIHADLPDFRVQCAYPDCESSYTSIKCLQRHLKKNHREFYMNVPNQPDHQNEHVQPDIQVNVDANEEEFVPEYGVQAEQEQPANIDIENEARKREIATILLGLREDYNLTSKSMSAISNRLSDILAMCWNESALKLNSFFHENGQEVPQRLIEVFQEESETSKCIKSLNTQFKLERFARSELNYVPPVEYVLGQSDQGKPETLEYVSIGETLKWFLGFDDIFEDAQKNYESGDTTLHDIFDGSLYKNHEILSEPDTLSIVLYLDEFTLTNPLRAHSRHQKILGTYFQLANMPVSKRSRLDSIHLVSLLKSDYVKKYGLRETNQYLVDELQELSTNGLDVEHEGVTHHFKCDLLVCITDNLAAHQVGGFFESFSANLSCRFCMVTKAEMQTGNVGLDRNPDTHNDQVNLVMKHPVLCTTYGIKGPSVFSDIVGFHCTTSLPSDIGHDMFEGVVKDVSTNVVKHCIQMGYVSLQDINSKIDSFPYKGADKVDKPNNIQANCELKQTFCKMWCLFRILPFILGDLVPENDEVWELFLMLREIVEQVCSKSIGLQQVETLRGLIGDFNLRRREIWPDSPLKPKDHYLLHYPDQILRYGPLVHVWTIRFEAKHHELGEIWKPSRCSKNISKSIARRHQFRHTAKKQGRQSYFSDKVVLLKEKKKKVANLPVCIRTLVTQNISNDMETIVSIGTGLKKGNTTYTRQMAFPISPEEEVEFVEPRHALKVANARYLVCQKLLTTGYNRHYHCYLVERSLELILIRESDLSHESCLGIYPLPNSAQLGITLKCKVGRNWSAIKFHVTVQERKKLITCTPPFLHTSIREKFEIPENENCHVLWYFKEVDDFVDYESTMYDLLLLGGINKVVVKKHRMEEPVDEPESKRQKCQTTSNSFSDERIIGSCEIIHESEKQASQFKKPKQLQKASPRKLSPKKTVKSRGILNSRPVNAGKEAHLDDNFQLLLPAGLRAKLDAQEKLLTSEQKDLLNAVYTNVTNRQCYYPSHYKTLAVDLLALYPYLGKPVHHQEAVGIWKDKIQDSFQNKRKRRDRLVPEVQDRISSRKVKEEQVLSQPTTSSQSAFTTRYGFKNYCPVEDPRVENDSTLPSHIQVLKAECKKRDPDRALISTLMDLTFQNRRWRIAQGTPVPEILEDFPAMTHEEEFMRELNRLAPPVDIGKELLSKVNQHGANLLSMSKKADRSQVETMYRQQALLATEPNEKKCLLGYAALFVLIRLLNEKADSLITHEKRESPAPYILASKPLNGTTDDVEFSIMVEGVTVTKTNELLRAVELYFGTAFMFNLSYNKAIRKTSTFVQHFFLGIREKEVTKALRRLYGSLVRAM